MFGFNGVDMWEKSMCVMRNNLGKASLLSFPQCVFPSTNFCNIDHGKILCYFFTNKNQKNFFIEEKNVIRKKERLASLGGDGMHSKTTTSPIPSNPSKAVGF
jgi:hypothetical protein